MRTTFTEGGYIQLTAEMELEQIALIATLEAIRKGRKMAGIEMVMEVVSGSATEKPKPRKYNKSRKFKQWDETELEQLVRLWNDGRSVLQITKDLKRSPSGVAQKLKQLRTKYGDKMIARRKRVPNAPMAELLPSIEDTQAERERQLV